MVAIRSVKTNGTANLRGQAEGGLGSAFVSNMGMCGKVVCERGKRVRVDK